MVVNKGSDCFDKYFGPELHPNHVDMPKSPKFVIVDVVAINDQACHSVPILMKVSQ